MLFNGRYDAKQDFIAVEIVEGQVQFTFSAGNELRETRQTVTANVEGGVSDGKWHTVAVSFLNQVGRLFENMNSSVITHAIKCKLLLSIYSQLCVVQYGEFGR